MLTFEGSETSGSVQWMRRLVAIALALEGSSKWPYRSFGLDSDQIRLCEPIGCLPALLESVIWPLWVVGVVATPWRSTGRFGCVSGAVALSLFLLADRQNYSNHGYLLALTLTLLCFLSSSASLVPRWPIQLLRWQIIIVYFFASLQKLRPPSLQGEILAGALNGPAASLVRRFPGAPVLLNLLAFATEVLLVFGLMVLGRHRRSLLVTGIGFHAATVLLLSRSSGMAAFAVLSVSFYPLFAQDQTLLRRMSLDGQASPPSVRL